MNELLRKLYQTAITYEEETYKMELKINDTIEEILKQYSDRFSSEDMEIIREVTYASVTVSEEESFQLGVRYAFKLLAEIFVST